MEESAQGRLYVSVAASQSVWFEGGVAGDARRQEVWPSLLDLRACVCAGPSAEAPERGVRAAAFEEDG